MNLLDEFDKQLASGEIDFRIRRILKYARCNLQRNLSLTQLAMISNVSVWHTCRLFRAELGLSPGRCIKLMRLTSAADLLANTSLSVKEVMAAVGINDESHFVRDFESVVAQSPSQYRIRSHTQKKEPQSRAECQVPPIIAKFRQ